MLSGLVFRRSSLDGHGRGENEGFSIKYDDGESGSRELLDLNGPKLMITHEVNLSCTPESGFVAGHRCLLEVVFEEPEVLVEAENRVLWIADFFSFCFGFCGEIGELAFKFGEASQANCLLLLVKGRAPGIIHASRLVLPYKNVADALGSLFAAWMDEGSNLHSPASLLTSLLTRSWDLPVDLRFVAAAQMLEALRRVGADLESMSDEDYRACKEAHKKALNTITDKHIAGLLKERARVGNSKGQNRLLRELIDRHEDAAALLFGDPGAFIDRHIDLRNGLTHRDGGLSVGREDLAWHTEGVLIFAYCVVWENLGLKTGEIERRIKEVGFHNTAIF